jgi:aromatic ring-opening dioxygenase catalytic subunit (LigB family)
LLYDYHGFPEHTYRLTWPAPGDPDLAARVIQLLAQNGIVSQPETTRGWDHGVFVPFKLVWPDADVPTVQLSLRRDGDPTAHLALGRALAPLRDEGVLIVGSGLSYHNLGNFFGAQGVADGEAFDAWLGDAVAADPDERERRLAAWRSAPGARASHPTPEHLLPLHVVAGAAGNDIGRRTFGDLLLGKPVSAFQFG